MGDRPAGAAPPLPVGLLEPEFGRFTDALAAGGLAAPDRYYATASRVMAGMARPYDDERQRNADLIDILAGGMTHSLVKREVHGRPGRTTGGSVCAGSVSAMALNLEMKHRGEPEWQNDAYFLQHTVRMVDGHVPAAYAARSRSAARAARRASYAARLAGSDSTS